MRGADDYCDRKLAQFEVDLSQLVVQVKAGRERLAAKADEPGADEGR